MHDLKALETQVNALIQKGEMIPATEQFYAENCVFQEGNQVARNGGKKAHLEYLKNFLSTVTGVNGIALHSQAIGEGVTLSEWTFDLATTKGPVLWNEVLRRHWADGKIISERFYTAAS
jgi:hypothetical protein